jgi:dCTP deaminase
MDKKIRTRKFVPGRGVLTRDKILEQMEAGNIIINPFEMANLNTTSYDARLGPYYYREHVIKGGSKVFNPLDEENVRRYWGEPQTAVRASAWMAENGPLKNINDDDYLIVFEPGETILAHTIEFTGGRHCVSTEMRARSTLGRVSITVCKCAGWGDLGYINRWTMEMTNHFKEVRVVLPVGLRVAQMIFFMCDPISTGSYVADQGKYQTSESLEDLIKIWTPDQMVPKLFKDRDIGTFQVHAKQALVVVS